MLSINTLTERIHISCLMVIASEEREKRKKLRVVVQGTILTML
jgi:hypothetical protein